MVTATTFISASKGSGVSEPAGENGKVTFTVKELLGKLDNKLDLVIAQLATKAEAHVVEELEKRVTALEGSAATETQLTSYRRWLLAFGTGSLISIGGLALSIYLNH